MIRPLRPEVATVCAAAFFVAVLNIAFWRQFIETVAPRNSYEVLFVAASFVVALCLLVLFFGLFAVPRVFKPVMTIFLLLGAAVAYFINEYGVVIDVDMVRNVFLTNKAEAADLITFKLLFYLLVLGGLPTVLLWACRSHIGPFCRSFGSEPKRRRPWSPSSWSWLFPSCRTSHPCSASIASCCTSSRPSTM